MKLKQILYEFSISSLKDDADQFINNLEKHESELVSFWTKNHDLGRRAITNELVTYINEISSKYNIKFIPGNGRISDKFSKMGLVGGAQWISDQSIDILYNDLLIDQFKDKNTLSKFLKALRSIIVHEITHRHQFLSMDPNFKNSFKMKTPKTRIDYLADRKEIAAYAHGAIEEFREHGYSNEEIEQLLKTPNMDDPRDKSKLMAKISNSFWNYYKTFYMDDENRVWEIFLKYCYKYLRDEA